ncbi:hypothetical protein Gohar_022076 [Gossypium harknessii]|uniref:Uncharacterized protein n=1 Tax=Gossypium harknessii TaxID=34285 RepID=A0A7J9I5T2_9ROSI|nr:hypothetical protein [Gossypium harknessii]
MMSTKSTYGNRIHIAAILLGIYQNVGKSVWSYTYSRTDHRSKASVRTRLHAMV